MKDQYHREISYLRLSVTDRCNLRCKYCMPEEGITTKQHNEILRNEEFVNIVKSAVLCGIRKVRITGGEPLVRRGIVELCREISGISGVEELAITTNGILLEEYSEALKSAGVKRVNISLDSLKADRYADITRGGDLSQVLRGLDKAIATGFEDIKINTVLMKNINCEEIKDFILLAREKGLTVRFIELMPVGQNKYLHEREYISGATVAGTYSELIEVHKDFQDFGIDGKSGNIGMIGNAEKSGVAQMYNIKGSKGRIGFINPMSQSFCGTCNRLRVTADGKIKPCLHSEQEILVKNLNADELEETIKRAILSKPENMAASVAGNKMEHGDCNVEGNNMGHGDCSVVRNMNEIGG